MTDGGDEAKHLLYDNDERWGLVDGKSIGARVVGRSGGV